jgi:NADPH:quinone reductase-like Zn-dependent oxidoreductase
VNPRAIVRPTDGYRAAKARTRLRRPILLITVDRRGTPTPARRGIKSGAGDNSKRRAANVCWLRGSGFQDTVRELTGGRGADVVYDNGGTATFSSSQLALRRHGVHAFYGNLMGVPTLQPTDLPASILLTYPQVFDHVPDQDSLRARVGDVFDLVVNGDLTPSIARSYGLADAPQAHRDLASRRTTGKLLLP